jgi:hypothetical protein
LRRLKSASGGDTHAQAVPFPTVTPKVLCVQCHRQNPSDRRFCGFCGSPLCHANATKVSGSVVSILGLNSRQLQDQLEFLREKSLTSAHYHPNSRTRSVVAVAALAIILSGVIYMKSFSVRSRMQSFLHSSQVMQPPVASTPPTQSAPAASVNTQQSGRNDNPPQGSNPLRTLPFAESTSDKTNDAGRTQPAQPPSTASESEAAGSDTNGTKELLLAEHYLDARAAAYKSGPAAALLWKAVGEHNTRASILLADLYLLGNGVPKNCNQARLLLIAAAEQGSPEGAQKLRNLESSGCR